jgi:hypothetical protein
MRASARAGALVAGIAMACSLAVPLAVPAGATPSPSVSCKSETSPLYAGEHRYTISKCTPTALKAGATSTKTPNKPNTGKFVFSTVWKNDKGTTTSHVKFTVISKGKCKAPFGTRLKVTGTVNSSTGEAATIVKKGEPITAFLCEITKGAKGGQTILEAGTTFKL